MCISGSDTLYVHLLCITIEVYIYFPLEGHPNNEVHVPKVEEPVVAPLDHCKLRNRLSIIHSLHT